VYFGRLLRDLAVGVHDVIRGVTDDHSQLRDRLLTALVATIVVDAIGTVLIYVLEHGKKQTDVHSVYQAFFWVSTQLLTVSSSVKNPLTTGGRAVDIVLELWAITVVTACAGAFAAFLDARSGATRR
jgi:hypothetical protein